MRTIFVLRKKLCDMAKYILQIIITQPIIVFSWGFNTPIATINKELRSHYRCKLKNRCYER